MRHRFNGSALYSFRITYLVFLFLIVGCNANKSLADPLVKKGKALYQSTCVACHHSDPKKEGPLGPPSWGASLDLLKKRIKEGTYPAGYIPKRKTKLMQPLPQLSDDDIRAIHAYLKSP